MAKRIMVVEDEADIREYLIEFLREKGYVVYGTGDGAAAIKLADKKPPDLVVLDLGLPTLSGESVYQELKSSFPDIIIIILTARTTSRDVVRGLQMGADDYISKPFIGEELLARIESRLRGGKLSNIQKVDDLEVNLDTFEVFRAKKKIDLTQREFQLLEYLLNHKNKIVTRESILNSVWYYSPDIESRVVDVYMGYLRKKIDKGFSKKLIVSKRGFGFMLKDPSTKTS